MMELFGPIIAYGSNSMKEPILLLGATGFTGRMTAAAMCRRGLPFAIAGRNAGRLEELARALPWRPSIVTVDVENDDSLRHAFEGRKAIVNCVGPFMRYGIRVVRAAVACGAHYVDSTGEVPYMRDVAVRFDRAAREAGVSITPATAYEVALADCAAGRLASELGGADEVEVLYSLDKVRISAGTALSALEVLRHGGLAYENSRWITERAFREMRRIPLPGGKVTGLGFPSGEIASIPLHVQTPSVKTFMALPLPLALGGFASGPAIDLLSKRIARALEKTAGRLAPDERQTRRTEFVISVRFRRQRRYVQSVVQGRDMYGVTAWILAYAADRLLNGDRLPAGVLAPSQLLDPVRFFQDIRSQWITEFERSL